MLRPQLPLLLALAVLVPTAASAQWPAQPPVHPGYHEGYQRGLRVGIDDGRRGAGFNFSVNVDFRRGDIGYRVQFGNRDYYRSEFRRGFEVGYQTGYRDAGGRYYGRPQPGAQQPPWSGGRAGGRFDVAVQQGYSDGYEAGLNDGHSGRRFDPISPRRYRSADRGYNRSYGSRDVYRVNYRNGFRSGYEAGYADAARYGQRW